MEDRIIALENSSKIIAKDIVDLKEIIVQFIKKVDLTFDFILTAIAGQKQQADELDLKINKLAGSIDLRFDEIEKRVEGFAENIVQLDARTTKGFSEAGTRITLEMAEVGKRIDGLSEGLSEVGTRITLEMAEVGKRIDGLSEVGTRITLEMAEVGKRIDGLSEEINKIGLVTGYNELLKNQAKLRQSA
ncbi:MAG: hypothetical protein EOO01_21740 [Chitinophagaceae bacterium]|nr:MAG: hypothetical protein EOO01_21740 [Chitinophagaceae bacterium]